jgi:hypothetical protein
MSSRPAVLALLAAAGLAGTLAAQVPVVPRSDSGISRLAREVDSLAGEWRRANLLATLGDSVGHADRPSALDTFAVASLRIIVNPSRLPVRQAAARAWPVIDAFYGDEARRLVDRPYYLVAVDTGAAGRNLPAGPGLRVPVDYRPEALAQLLELNAPVESPGRAFEAWLGQPVRPAIRERQQLEAAYLELVTSPFRTTHECLLGRLDACLAALGLDTPHDPVRHGYADADDRRFVVHGLPSYAGGGEATPARQSCEAGQDRDCIAFLASLPETSLPLPLGRESRASLMRLALRAGGREAYTRLIRSDTVPLPDRLGLVAGMPVESLVGRWRIDVLAARPEPVALPPIGPPAALVWVAVFGACGVGSSRWRLG